MKKRIDDKGISLATGTDWTLMRSFLAVVREGSLSAAARYTSLTQPTIGRHIADLEATLGVSLFTRSSSGLIPTEIALSLVEDAEAMEGAFASLVRKATLRTNEEQPVGTVRITTHDSMGTFVLPQLLADVRYRLPRIALELALSGRLTDILRREADIAVRMVRPQQDGLVARKLGMIHLGLYAHQNYVQRYGEPRTLGELAEHHLVGFDKDDQILRIGNDGTLPLAREMFSLRVDSSAAQVMSVRAGLGIGIIITPMVRAEPEMVAILPRDIAINLECWIVVHEDQKSSPIVRPVYEMLGDGLANWIRGP